MMTDEHAHCDLCLEGTVLCPEVSENAVVLIDEGRILWVGPRGEAPAFTARHTLASPIVAPGLIDLHVHGAAGADVADGNSSTLETILRAHAAHGTTAMCPTVLASAPQKTLKALEVVRGAAENPVTNGARVLGAHLEGPFLNPRRAGAQPVEHLVAPDRGFLAECLAAAGGTLRIMTLAPELPGALEIVEQLREEDVVVAVGHSDATYSQTMDAFAAGCTLATHIFNAMRGIHHREPGVVGAALDEDGVTAEVIADGHHLSSPILRLLRRLKGPPHAPSRANPGKIALITDCIAALEAPSTGARLGDEAVHVEGGAARLADGTLAGSVLTMERAVSGFMKLGGATLAEALVAASACPANVLGENDLGSVRIGGRADLVLLDHEATLRGVVIDGRVLPTHACIDGASTHE